jgi:hypothetical protein
MAYLSALIFRPQRQQFTDESEREIERLLTDSRHWSL